MKKTSYILLLAAAACAAASCTEEVQSIETPVSGEQMTFTAVAAGQTKTVVENGNSVYWSPKDEISVFYGSKAYGRFTSTNTVPAAKAEFSGSFDSVSGSVNIGISQDKFWGVYPYSAENNCDGSSVTLTVPAVQTAVEGSFDPTSFPSVAMSSGTNLAFWNVCGGVKFTVSNTGIKSVTFAGRGGEYLAGKVRVQMDADGHPVVKSVSSGVREITVNAPDGGAFKPGVDYYMAVRPVALNSGFTMKFTKAAQEGTYTQSTAVEVRRSVFGVLAAKDAGIDFIPRQDSPVFTASFEQNATKISIDSDHHHLFWTADDRLAIFTNTSNRQYRFMGKTGDDVGDFEAVDDGGLHSGNDLERNYAIYPYAESTEISNDGTFTCTLPAVQAYAHKSFGLGANTLVAVTQAPDDYSLLFKSVCSYLVVRLYGEGRVRSIELKGNNGEKIAGTAAIVAEYGKEPQTIMSDTATETITIDCGETGVTLGTSSAEATEFWFCIPPVTFSQGFMMRVTDIEGKIFEKGATSSVTIQRSVIYFLGALEVTLTPEIKDLSANGTANCYIVSEYGPCKFDATKKGHTSENVGAIASAEVLWESFGNDVQPQVGDVVSDVSVKDGIVSFTATGNDGNAVIAVKDATGTILWSWHIWVCQGFDPAATAQVYYNNAGTVMDRNLGATSAAKGDVRALGLLYQWGRKDPFLGSSSISSKTKARSTISAWPSTVSSNASNGTIDYVVKHPATFVLSNTNNYDWYYTGSSSTDNTRWNSAKGMYDPCPKGWRIPDGGDNGLWSKALGSSSSFSDGPWDSTNKGMDFTGRFSASSEVWYPASGYLSSGAGSLNYVGYCGVYWSCTPDGIYACSLNFYNGGSVSPSGNGDRAYCQSVRCLQE